MTIANLISQRSVETHVSWDVVYEWEDILAAACGARLVKPPMTQGGILSKIVRHCPALGHLIPVANDALVFEMNAPHLVVYNRNRIIPWIIDFFLRTDDQMQEFYRAYSENPCVLISSREAYEYLHSWGCSLPIRHLALSISDKYRITAETRFEKKYDLALLGRSSPKLLCFLGEYVRKHPGFDYITREWTKDFKAIYRLSSGPIINSDDTREEYLRIMRASRACFYSTPSMDVASDRANGFNQVTPRFLEMVACGCHVIARYNANPDTRYFDLEELTPNVDSYEMFEQVLDRCRCDSVDMRKYSAYLERHYTSVRARELANIVSGL